MTQPMPVSIPARPMSVALVDISYLFKKRYHTVNTGVPFAAAKATLQDVDNLRRGVAHLIICRDAPPYSHRLEVFKDYKATRPVPEPEEIAQRKYLWAELKQLGFNVAWCQGYEADDVIATLAKEYSVWCDDVRIVTVDKDAAQCISERVKQYIPPVGDKDWEVRDVAGVMRKFGVAPAHMPLWQGLVGDTGDHVPGVHLIGPKIATDLVNKYRTLEGLAAGMAEMAKEQGAKPSATVRNLASGWDNLVMSLKLVTLDTKVPLDTEALLVRRAAEPSKPTRNDMEVEMDGYVGNETPMPPKPEDEALAEASRLYQEALPNLQRANDTTPPAAAKDAELLEQESDRERERNDEHDAVSNAPGEKAAERVATPAKARPAASTAIVTTQTKYGIVTAELQPMDLQSAYHVSDWLCKGNLYPQFKTPAQIFTIIARGKELGIGMTTALAGFHMVEGKPAPSADLIRALVERDPNFEYLMPIEMSATRVVWRGKHKKHPTHVDYAYTIEEARLAGLCRSANFGKPGNWEKRPQDMLMKTGGSKLARLLWPGATLGLYCIEELGYSESELSQQEAA